MSDTAVRTVSDPIAALAITMQARKGTFALLLGSGISRSAQIPTGWDIVLQLIERVAAVHGETVEGPADEWFEKSRGREASYSDLLNELAPMAAERSLLIRPFIEPTPDEAEIGLKQPTQAHRSIARLVADGYVRVIVTTNFDRLLEIALTDAGVTPTVISSADSVAGAFPLAHNACTVIKIHGDYVDARILNTTNELSQYEEPLLHLLEQVFREYGLIISGWSATWDTALREVLTRVQSPWFSTYWIAFRSPSGEAREVVAARNGQVITDMGADEFFSRLDESVQSVADLTVPELVSSAIAVATMKRYIDDPTKRTRIFDILVGEASRVRRAEIDDVPDGHFYIDPTAEAIAQRFTQMEASTSVFRSLLTTVGYWGRDEHASTVVTCLEKLGRLPSISGTYDRRWADLRNYPALLGLYAFALGAVAGKNYSLLWSVLTRARSLDFGRTEEEPLVLLAKTSILDKTLQEIVRPNSYDGVFIALRLREGDLWQALEPHFTDRPTYLRFYASFEYLYGMVGADVANQLDSRRWPNLGTLPWLEHGYAREQEAAKVKAAIESPSGWEPAQSGMFDGSKERVIAAMEELDRAALQAARY